MAWAHGAGPEARLHQLEVAHILAIASETRTAIVAPGGNTGLVGGQVPRGKTAMSRAICCPLAQPMGIPRDRRGQ